MTRLPALEPAALLTLLDTLPLWRHDPARGAIDRSFQFKDFGEAFAFMTAQAQHAERHDHHPDWRNIYNRVDISLTTHDAGGLTERDIRLALAADRLHRQLTVSAS